MAPRTIFISGASSGIGRALALEYGKRGAHVALSARRVEALEQVAEEVKKVGGKALVLPFDITHGAEVAKEVLTRADHEMGSLDMVIASAGLNIMRHATRLTMPDVDRVIETNVRGTMHTLVAAIPIMLLHQKGHLVGISSLAGRLGVPTAGVYSASKAALSTFLESLRVDLKASGIRVTDVQPGFVDTPMVAKSKHPLPFLWSAEKAARVMVKRLDAAPALIAFPWPLTMVTRIMRDLPAWVTDPVLRMVARN